MSHQPQNILSKLVTEGATGEFIWTNTDSELHVHLQEGRIAWAASSGQVPTFAKYIVDRCEIDMPSLRYLVRDCHQSGRPLNRTLVELGVGVSLVRDAVQQQVRQALAPLKASLGSSGSTRFLPRKTYDSYDTTFTLDYADVTQRSFEAELAECVKRIPSLKWIEHRRGSDVRAHLADSPSILPDLAECAAHSDGHLIILRSPQLNVIGAALDGDDGWVWCGVGGESLLASALLTLKTTLPLAPCALESTPQTSGIVVSKETPLSAVASSLLADTPELLAVSVANDVSLSTLAHRQTDEHAVEKEYRPAQKMLGIAQRAAAKSFNFNSVHVASATSQVFGGTATRSASQTGWLQLHPSAHTALGWTLLQSWTTTAKSSRTRFNDFDDIE